METLQNDQLDQFTPQSISRNASDELDITDLTNARSEGRLSNDEDLNGSKDEIIEFHDEEEADEEFDSDEEKHDTLESKRKIIDEPLVKQSAYHKITIPIPQDDTINEALNGDSEDDDNWEAEDEEDGESDATIPAFETEERDLEEDYSITTSLMDQYQNDECPFEKFITDSASGSSVQRQQSCRLIMKALELVLTEITKINIITNLKRAKRQFNLFISQLNSLASDLEPVVRYEVFRRLSCCLQHIRHEVNNAKPETAAFGINFQTEVFKTLYSSLLESFEITNIACRRAAHECMEKLAAIDVAEPMISTQVIEEEVVPMLLNLCDEGRVADELKSDSLCCLLHLINLKREKSESFVITSLDVKRQILGVWLENSPASLANNLNIKNPISIRLILKY